MASLDISNELAQKIKAVATQQGTTVELLLHQLLVSVSTQASADVGDLGSDDSIVRHHIGADLADRDEKYRQLVDNALQGIAIFQQGCIVFANQAMATISGYPLEALLTMSSEEVVALVHPDDVPKIVSNAQNWMDGEQAESQYEFRIYHKNGDLRTLETFESPTTYQSKSAMQRTFVDITLRRQAEETLRRNREQLEALVEERTKQLAASEQRHRIIAETITDYVYSGYVYPDHSIHTDWVDGAFEKITGYSLERLAETDGGFAALIHPDDLLLLATVGEQLRTKGSLVIQYRIISADGQMRWLQDYARITDIDPETDTHHVLGAVQDITEKKQIETALAIEKHQSEVILQHIADAVLLTDVDANIIYANPAWERLTGYSVEEVKGENTVLLHSGKTPEATYDNLQQTLFNDESWTGIFFNKRKDNSEYDALSTITPVKSPEGDLIQFVQIHRDVTEERQTAAMKQAFVANAAHDLKNPLGVLRNTVFLLKHDKTQLDRWVSLFEEQIDILQLLVDDLLTLSRLDRHDMPLARKPIDFTTLVRKLIEGQRVLAAERGLNITFDAPDKPCMIHADGGMLQRVVVNLVDNAVHYTPTTGGVSISIHQESNFAVFSVEDTGIGIAPSDLPHIFDRFYRSNLARESTRGTGLGLSIVKEVVELHQGRIDVKSAPQEGTRVVVYLPMEAHAMI